MGMNVKSILTHSLFNKDYNAETWAKTIIFAYGSADILGQDHVQAFLENVKENYKYPKAAAIVLIVFKYFGLSEEALKPYLFRLIDQFFVERKNDDQSLEISSPVYFRELYEHFKDKPQISGDDIKKYTSENQDFKSMIDELITKELNRQVVSGASSFSSLYKVPVKPEEADASASVSSFRPQ